MARAPKKAPAPKAAPKKEPVNKPIDNPHVVFTNTTELTTIHIGDGRRIAPGESVEVPAYVKELLQHAQDNNRDRGLA